MDNFVDRFFSLLMLASSHFSDSNCFGSCWLFRKYLTFQVNIEWVNLLKETAFCTNPRFWVIFLDVFYIFPTLSYVIPFPFPGWPRTHLYAVYELFLGWKLDFNSEFFPLQVMRYGFFTIMTLECSCIKLKVLYA